MTNCHQSYVSDQEIIEKCGPLTTDFITRLLQTILRDAHINIDSHDLYIIESSYYEIIWDAPASSESRDILEEFEKAASNLFRIFNTIRFEAAKAEDNWQPKPHGSKYPRINLAAVFLGEKIIDNRNLDEKESVVWNSRDYITYITEDLTLLQRRARYVLNQAPKIGKGKGRKDIGYDRFILACRQIWMLHRSDKGYSTKLGRGSGQFVRFVFLAQVVMPQGRRKETEGAVGDAIVKALKETTRK